MKQIRIFTGTILLMVVCLKISAQQNQVPNGDFEYYTSCPVFPNNYADCTGWQTWNQLTPDYFNACFTSGGLSVDVPSNFRGYQFAASGDGYMGCGTGVTTNVRELVTRPIIPLSPGGVYDVSLSVSLANGSYSGSDEIGVYFYDNSPNYYNVQGVPSINNNTIVPQVIWHNVLVTDTLNWVRLSGVFIADSAYDNVAIGPFKFGTSVNYTQIGTNQTPSAYYYFDSVVVRLRDTLAFFFTDTLQCSGNTVTVPFYCFRKKLPNNIFSLQLSDASGSFSSPVNIGSLNSDTSGTIIGTIPANTPTGTGYRLRITASNFADTTEESVAIKIGQGPVAKPDANNNGPVCNNDTLKLTATSGTSGVTWSWTGPNAFTSALQNPTIPNPLPVHSGNYIVTARLHGCTSKDTTTAVVSAGNGPTGTLATSNAPVCADDVLNLYGTANGTGNNYSWIGPNGFTSNQQNPVLLNSTTSQSGDYVVYVSNGNCTSRDTVTVLVKPRPANVNAIYNGPVCAGEALNFTASSSSTGISYTWTGPNSFNSSFATPVIGGSSPVHNGEYIATVTLNGCSLKDTVTVLVKPLPAKPDATTNGPVCAGQTLNVDAASTTSGVSWSWTGPNGFTSTTATNSFTNSATTLSGDYIVTATLSGCSIKDTAAVLVKPLPLAVSASNNGPKCAGDTVHVMIGTSTTGVSYTWTGPNGFTANTQNTYVANGTTAATGWYKATLTLNGCTYKDSTFATVNAVPGMPVINYNNPLCIGEALNLTTGTLAGASYNWSGANGFTGNTQSPTRSNMQFGDTGLYKLTVTLNGCTSPEANTRIKINPLPFVVVLATPGDTICKGQQATFTALPNNHGGTPTYRWMVNNIFSGATGTTFSTTALNHMDVVKTAMTESTKCSAPYVDESNETEMKVLPWLAPLVTIAANPNRPLDVDEYVTFTATVVNGGPAPQYQWKRNGQNIVGAKGATWAANTLNDNDSISVEVISSYKCPQPLDAKSNGIRVKMMSSVDGASVNTNSIMLYPNPNSGSFTLKGKVNTNAPVALTVINAIGQVMYKNDVRPVQMVVNTDVLLPGIAAGVYTLMLHTAAGVSVLKFTVR